MKFIGDMGTVQNYLENEDNGERNDAMRWREKK